MIKILLLFLFLLSYILSRLDTHILWIDLFGQLSFQILIGGTFLTIIYLIYKKFWVAILSGLICVLLAYQILLPCKHCNAVLNENTQSTKNIRLMTFNTSYSYRNDDFSDMIDQISKEELDIIIFQETSPHFQEQLKILNEFFPYNVGLNTPVDFWGGIILSKYPLTDIQEGKNNSVIVNFLLEGSEITVVAIHLYPPISQGLLNSTLQQMAYLKEFINSSNHNIILIGDLNMTPVSRRFTNFLKETNLYTYTSFMHPTFTWPAFLPSILGIQIDHVLFSENFKIVEKKTINHFGSNHRPLLVDLIFESKK